MKKRRIHIPLVATTLILTLLSVWFDPSLRGLFTFHAAQAVGGYDAVNVLGPGNFTGEGTWEFLFFPVDTILESAHDSTANVNWAVTSGDVYYCDMSTMCDEETDWISYAMSNTLQSIAIDQATQVLYVGTIGASAEVLRCDINATGGCDEESDWTPAFAVDMTGVFDNADALISAGGFMFVGVHGNTASGPTTIYLCDLSTDCDDTGEWNALGNTSHGGSARQFLFDEADNALYLGYRDSSGSGYTDRCDLATGCDDDADWVFTYAGGGPGEATAFNAMTLDTDNDVIYMGVQTTNEGGDMPTGIVRCDAAATSCDEQSDWEQLDTDGNDIDAIIWEPVTSAVYASSGSTLYRCATSTGCDDFGDFRIVSNDAGQNTFTIATAAGVLFSSGDAVYRCELSTGCGAGNELDGPLGVAHDEAGQRLFVSDSLHSRVLVYDLSDGLDDGEEPVNVLGQPDFFETGCNQGNGPGDGDINTLCQPAELAYDGTNNRLFVGDFSNNRVMVFDTSAISDGMDASFELGQTDFNTFDCETDQTSLCETQSGLAYDSANERLFVGDLGNRRVMVFDVAPGTISSGEPAINVIGTPDFITDPGSCTVNQATTCSPFGAALNEDDEVLFVADGSSHRVTTFNVDPAVLIPNTPSTDGPNALNVLGQANFTDVGNGTSATTMTNPSGLSYDGTGKRLFVTDSGNNRVLQFDTTTIEDGEAAVDVYGQDDLDSGVSGTTQSSLQSPYTLTYMPGDDLIAIADTTNDRIMFFDAVPNGGGGGPTGGHEATDLLGELDGAGEPRFEKGGPNNGPNDKGLSFPHDFAIDPNNHRLFLADGANGRVMEFDLDTSDHLIDHVADHLLGSDDLFANTGDCSDTKIVDPHGLAYDSTTDRLFMSDSCGSGRVVVWDLSGGLTDTMAATWVLGAVDFGGTEGPTAQNDVNRPSYLALDEAGQRLFVGDPGNARVLVFDIADITSGENAVNVLGQEDFTSNTPGLDQDSLGSSSGFLEMGMAYDSNNDRLFVGDLANHRTMVFDVNPGTITDGEDADNVLGQETFFTDVCTTSRDGQCEPVDAAYDDATDRLFVSDSNNTRVLVYDLSGGISDGMDATNVIGEDDFDTNTSQTTQDGFAEMRGILFDPVADYLYVAEFGNVRGMIFDVATVDDGEDAVDMVGELDDAGGPKYSKSDSNNGPNQEGFNQADYAALDTVHHRLFATDLGHNRVLVFNLDASNRIVDRTADFVLGQPDFTSGAAREGINGVSNASGISYDGINDRLFVTDANHARVLVFDTATITNGEDAVNVLGQLDFDTNTCGTSATTMCGPLSVSIEPFNGLLAVADVGNNRVLLYDLSGGITNGMAASKVFCQPDFDTNIGGTASDACSAPQGVLAEINTDSLWVADTDNNRVLRFDLFGASSAPAMNVLGQSNFTSGGPATTQDGMDYPVRLAIIESDGTDQRLFVADYDNNRVLVFNTADGIDDGEDAVDAYGQPDFTSSDCGTTISNLCAPVGLDYDETLQTLYVADKANNRVLVFGPAAPTPAPTPAHGGHPSPTGFHPDRIVINDDDATVRGRNVLVTLYATISDNFAGDVQVLISNDSTFGTTIPFDYHIPETNAQGSNQDAWPKIVPWDMCFGLTGPCDPGTRTVYARFYVNKSQVRPALTPRPAGLQ